MFRQAELLKAVAEWVRMGFTVEVTADGIKVMPKPAEKPTIDGNRANNLPPNLREATQAENMRNTALRSDNMSGVMGVSWDKENRRWRADIRVNGRRFNLGRFRSIQDAISARKAAEREHQFHENHGKIRPDTSETSHA